MGSSCGKHEGGCDVLIVCRQASPLTARVGDGILVQSTMQKPTVLKVAGAFNLNGGFCELHCEEMEV